MSCGVLSTRKGIAVVFLVILFVGLHSETFYAGAYAGTVLFVLFVLSALFVLSLLSVLFVLSVE